MKHIRFDNRINAVMISLLLSVALIFGIPGITNVAFATESEEELESVEAQEEEAKAEREEIEARIVVQQEEVARLNEQVDAKQQELEEKQIEIDELIVEINDQRHSIDERKEGLYARVRGMYKKGLVSVLDVLLDSASFTELLTNLSMVQIIYRYDQETLLSLEDEYASLKEKMAEYGKAKAEMEIAQAELETERNNAAYAEAQLQESLEYVKAKIEELEAERERIAAIVAEEQRLAAEAAAAAGYVFTGGEGMLIWPVSGPISSYFGYRDDPFGAGIGSFHDAIDISVPTGTPVYAPASGTVSSATGWQVGGGYTVIINHEAGLSTCCAHNSSIVVSPGEYVAQGQLIAYSGSTGWSTGPHVHFAVMVNGVNVDPLAYL